MAGNWSPIEVEAVVADYFAMLKDELRGLGYNKTAHRRMLATQLSDRTDGSIERKHQNISAILREHGHPWIDGYKPLGNYQALLGSVVADRLAADKELALLAERSALSSATIPDTEGILDRLTDPPVFDELVYSSAKERLKKPGRNRTRFNYLELESRNSSLGLAGENFVMQYERERLVQLDSASLADRIEHVSVSEGDGAGFDIRSFESDGTDKFIEVKTTAYGKLTPFFVSRNEIAVSDSIGSRYHLLRLFKFRENPLFYALNGSIEQRCLLDPVQFSARPRGTSSVA